MFDLFCPVSQRRRISMEACHLKSLPRQNTNTPCHQSEFLQIIANISDVIFYFFLMQLFASFFYFQERYSAADDE